MSSKSEIELSIIIHQMLLIQTIQEEPLKWIVIQFSEEQKGTQLLSRKLIFPPVPLTGHDTTASAICWSLYNLAHHDHYQEQCRKEVMDLMEGRDVDEIKW